MYKVLVVDDERFVRQNVINSVKWEEFNLEVVAQAKNGQEALEMVDQYNPNIIITDIKMP
jgi:two-component system response regulator YesN